MLDATFRVKARRPGSTGTVRVHELTSALRKSDWKAGFAALCDRFAHSGTPEGRLRARQRRLVALSLAAPFLIVAAAILISGANLSVGMLLALICAVPAAGWSVSLILALTGRQDVAEALALGLGSAMLAVLIAAGGGAASPIMLLAAVPAVEAAFVVRRGPFVAGGIGAAIATMAMQFGIGALLPQIGATPAASAWIVVFGYIALSVFRMRVFFAAEAGRKTDAMPAVDTCALAGGVRLDLDDAGAVGGVLGDLQAALGIDAEHIEGEVLLQRVHVADRVAYLAALAEARAGSEVRKVNLRLRSHASAADRFVNASLRLLRDGNGVTAFLQGDAENAELRSQLANAADAAQEVELAKGRFLGAVSHELRTPLNAIIGFSDMLLHNMAGELPSGRQRDYVGLIRDSGHHLLSVVNAILDVSKIEAGAYAIQAEPFALEEAVDLCQGMMAPLAEAKGVALSVRQRPDLGELTADRRAVQQIIINLVSNAIKFTPAGGDVSIETARYGSRVEIAVSDSGIGIAATDLARLGQPFVQVCNDITRGYEGTGLGLSLVKGLVQLHEGEMSMESAPGEGTTVRILLPVGGPKEKGRESAEKVAAMKPATRNGDTDATIRKIA